MKKLARDLRTHQTDAEQLLWRHLRSRLFMGTKFRRQQVIRPYIVDFVCFEQRLILELDGGQHAENMECDIRRTAFLGSQGFRVVRFWNNEVLSNMEGVLETVQSKLICISPHPSPLPSPARGEGAYSSPRALPQGRRETASHAQQDRATSIRITEKLPLPLRERAGVRGDFVLLSSSCCPPSISSSATPPSGAATSTPRSRSRAFLPALPNWMPNSLEAVGLGQHSPSCSPINAASASCACFCRLSLASQRMTNGWCWWHRHIGLSHRGSSRWA